MTEELAIWPEGASFATGDFDGRISKARVTEPGPFSAFQGFDRVLVVTRGSGLRLFHGDSAPSARVACLEPYSFSGDWPTTADLPDGPVADFNVIVRRGRCRADVSVDRIPRFGGSRIGPRAATGDLFAHVLSGEVRARTVPGDDLGALGPGESVWIRDAQQGESLRLLRGRSDGDVEALRAAAAPEEHPAVVLLVWITPV